MIKVNELLNTMVDFDKLSKVIIIIGGKCIPYNVKPADPDPGLEYATEDHLKLLNDHGSDRVEKWYYPRVRSYLFIEIKENKK